MSDPKMIKGNSGSRFYSSNGQNVALVIYAEAQILQAIAIDYIDESEVLSPADDVYHIDKTKFTVPFVCGAKILAKLFVALQKVPQ